MTVKNQAVRGTHDLVADQCERHRWLIEEGWQVAKTYGYQWIDTPIFEFTEVFKRTLGDTSDIVTKEMYNFNDRGGESLCLRPEGTAGVARAFIEHGWHQSIPCKFYYAGPMFRYERPQKGRQRQFHQIGVELLGPSSPQADVESIIMAWHFLQKIGLGSTVQLEINSLGDEESRLAYRTALVDYFKRFAKDLSEDSQQRLERNPLRILDSKDEKDRKIIQDAPKLGAFLTGPADEFYEHVQAGLQSRGIQFKKNPYLVRGLDYYSHTIFEITSNALGSQATVLAGGRYDQLISMMGGPATSAVGWSAGIERLALLTEAHTLDRVRPVTIIPVAPAQEKFAWDLAQDLREKDFTIDMLYDGAVKKRMKYANRVQALYALIIGEEELAQDKILVKNLDTGQQEALSRHRISAFLSQPYF